MSFLKGTNIIDCFAGVDTICSAVWEVVNAFLLAAGLTTASISSSTPLMDAGLDSLDMLKLARQVYINAFLPST
jgi:hypothetical protein